MYPDMEKNMQKLKRKFFAGKTAFFITSIGYSTSKSIEETTAQRERDKTERHFYQRMLRAYHKGAEYFNFGYHYDNNFMRIPTKHKVLVEWK